MNFPNELKYSKEHTWLRIEDEIAIIGITEFAQSELGEIVYVDMPNVGLKFKQEEVFGSIEALKTVSDLFMPIGGEIIEVNKNLLKNPTKVNTEPYGDGWIIKIKPVDLTELNKIHNSEEYKELTGQ